MSYSDICTNVSGSPLSGVIKPCPLDLQKYLTFPDTSGFLRARADLHSTTKTHGYYNKTRIRT